MTPPSSRNRCLLALIPTPWPTSSDHLQLAAFSWRGGAVSSETGRCARTPGSAGDLNRPARGEDHHHRIGHIIDQQEERQQEELIGAKPAHQQKYADAEDQEKRS